MTGPRRVQVQGDLFHGRVPDGAIYAGRPAPSLKGSRYANPFKTGHRAIHPATGREVVVLNREHAVTLYAELLARQERTNPEWAALARRELAGQDLACWCSPPDVCHVDELLPFVNEPHFDCGHRRSPENTYVQTTKATLSDGLKAYRYERCRACHRQSQNTRNRARSQAQRQDVTS